MPVPQMVMEQSLNGGWPDHRVPHPRRGWATPSDNRFLTGAALKRTAQSVMDPEQSALVGGRSALGYGGVAGEA